MTNAGTHMKEGIYIPDYVFTCSGVIQTYSMTIFPHIAVENELWEDTLVSTIEILSARDSTPLGQIRVQMDHSEEDGHTHQTELHVINGSVTGEIFVQEGDYVRIITPRSSYNSDAEQFVNRHIPVAMVPSTEHNITHYFDCDDAILSSEPPCNRMEVLPLQAAISFFVDERGKAAACLSTTPHKHMRMHTHTHKVHQHNHILPNVVIC